MSMVKPRSSRNVPWNLDLGAAVLDPSTVQFRVWSPSAQSLQVKFYNTPLNPLSLRQDASGYWEGKTTSVKPGMTYTYVIDKDLERPDPASRYQPEGVHGPSQVIDPQAFTWTDQNWKGLPLEEYIIYELHVGTFTPKSTFDGIIGQLPYLRDQVGVTAIELLPVAQCPGTRNWGYDGTYLFAPQSNYGGPEGLKRFIDACHAHGLAIIMDVVYNHLGPEGNYLGSFGPYFTNVYQTPWGNAINYDGPYSDAVRHYIISNALYWVTEYHIDALRLDAIHGIFDFSAKHILQEIAEAVHDQAQAVRRSIHVIAESDLNNSRIITPIRKGGYGLDGQWNDDFHHALHCLLTGENKGYYEDFGKLDHLVKAWKEGFVYSGQYSPHRKRRHGNSAKQCLPSQFVVCAQNHDQIGNRAMGDRHSTLVPYEALKVSNATVLLCSNIPLLFMGEEYGEKAPFLYFIDHSDPELIEAVRQGRKREFQAFGWTDVPDPYSPETYESSRIRPHLDTDPQQKAHLHWVHMLIRARKHLPALGTARKGDKIQVWSLKKANTLIIHRKAHQGPEALLILGFNKSSIKITANKPEGTWHLLLDSEATEFGGSAAIPPPQQLTITKEHPCNLERSPFCAWVYLNTKTVSL